MNNPLLNIIWKMSEVVWKLLKDYHISTLSTSHNSMKIGHTTLI